MRFANPELLLLLVPLLAFVIVSERRRSPAGFAYPSLRDVADITPTWRVRLHKGLPWLRAIALAACVVALARPQWGVQATKVFREGIAIGAVLDVSSSMGATDLQQGDRPSNRLDVVKQAFHDFVTGDSRDLAGREGDLIGLVTFARFADAVSPMTLDHDALTAMLDEVELVPLPEEDGTAIGDGIMLGVQSLERAQGESRVLIVLTDGSNNAGNTEPLRAAQAARALGIKIYTIGAGSQGTALTPVPSRNGGTELRATQVFIDEYTLTKVAELTGGRYFRADDAAALHGIYAEIDRLEKAKNTAEHYQRYIEGFSLPLLIGLGLLLLEATLSSTRLRTAP